MLKKIVLLSLFLHLPLSSAEAAPKEKWLGGSFELLAPDSDKPEPNGYLDGGEGFGLEYGFRFNEHWAARLEVSRLSLGTDSSRTGGANINPDGNRVGVDAMYFMRDHATYVFAGIKKANYGYDHDMANLGLGRHWQLSENWMMISEAAVYHDFGQSHRDIGVKLGLAYTFGETVAGRPSDDDGDGVMNASDQCPNTPMGTQVDSTGCNVDEDGDGVINTLDECPNTPAGTTVNTRGCEMQADKDSDNDGVMDANDQCPDTPVTDRVDSAGCSIFEDREVRQILDVKFAHNSDQIRDEDAQDIQAFAQFMERFPNTTATIEGHTSAPGSEAYNMELSQRRAKAVKQLLVEEYGIDQARLDVKGFGESRLLDPSDTREAHRTNRRIEARVTAMEKVKANR